jgi:hypothetical protein
MQTLSRSASTNVWRELYVAALFESDSAKLAARIAEAERALVVRARELFHETGDNIEEEEAVDNAMYSLNALRSVYRCGRAPAQSQAKAA